LEIINPVWFTKPLSPSELCIHNNDLQIYQTYFENKVENVKHNFLGHCPFQRVKIKYLFSRFFLELMNDLSGLTKFNEKRHVNRETPHKLNN